MLENTATIQNELTMTLNQLKKLQLRQVAHFNKPITVQHQLFSADYKLLLNQFYTHNQFSLIAKIDLLDLLFEINLNQFTLPNALIQQYELLKPMCLNLAMQDDSFFLEKNNKLAEFLSQTAQLISGKIKHNSEAVYQEILMCSIEQLLQKSTLSTADLKSATIALLSKLNSKNVENIKITHTFDDPSDKNSKQAIERLLLKQSISDEVRNFLVQTWSQVLSSIAREEGEKSKNYLQALKVATLIVWSLNVKRVMKDYPKFLKSLAIIFSSIAEGLKKINTFDQYFIIFSQVLTLEHAHIIAQVENQLLKVKQTMRAQLKTTDDSKSRKIYNQTLATSDTSKQYIEFAKTLNKGDWLNLQGKAVPIRIKLIWKARDHSEFIFVNQSGEKVKECSLLALAADLENQIITEINSKQTSLASHNSVLKTIG